jgi:galactokinase
MARALLQQNLLSNTKFLCNINKIYSENAQFCAERYSKLTEGLSGSIRFFSSPGRAELVGNHTDHNHGFVIASSIDMDVVGAVMPTFDNKITIRSYGYPAFTVDINMLDIKSELCGTSLALVQGVVKGFLNKGHKVGGFIANTHSTIFKGAGVSSSAAFELLVCEILNVLYNDSSLDFVEKALISQYAENVYFGKPSGLMDQLTISRGGVSFMDFLNPNLPVSSTVKWNFDDISIVIINCGGDHCNLTGEYASIKQEMQSVANYFGKTVLREVAESEFYNSLPNISKKLSGRAILRAIHFFEEDNRVLEAKNSIINGNKEQFLEIINSSGNSSYKLLQNCYASGDTEQRVPLALAIASNDKDVLASRVHGGGFAGTILAFIDKNNSNKFENFVKTIFGNENVFNVNIRHYGAIEIDI